MPAGNRQAKSQHNQQSQFNASSPVAVAVLHRCCFIKHDEEVGLGPFIPAVDTAILVYTNLDPDPDGTVRERKTDAPKDLAIRHKVYRLQRARAGRAKVEAPQPGGGLVDDYIKAGNTLAPNVTEYIHREESFPIFVRYGSERAQHMHIMTPGWVEHWVNAVFCWYWMDADGRPCGIFASERAQIFTCWI